MAQDNQDNPEQPKYLTHDDLNGALAAQKRDFQKMMTQNQTQFQSLLESFNSAFGPKPETPAVPSKSEIAEDTATLKQQIKQLLERDKQRDESEKRMKMEKNLRDSLGKHGINSRADLAVKYLQDQVSYDEDGQLVMKFEAVPGVIQPLPLAEAISKFAQTEHGKFLADPRDTRGSGLRGTVTAPGSQANSTVTSQITGNSAAPVFKDAKALKQYVANELGKETLKY